MGSKSYTVSSFRTAYQAPGSFSLRSRSPLGSIPIISYT